ARALAGGQGRRSGGTLGRTLLWALCRTLFSALFRALFRELVGIALFFRRSIDRLKLETELHGRIVERDDGVERHRQALGNAAERQPDLKGALPDRQIPELVL